MQDEAALDHHRGSPHFHQYAIGGLYQKMKERQSGESDRPSAEVFPRLFKRFLRLMVPKAPVRLKLF